jgi:thiamine-phosphate diphosphorylase
LTDRETFALGKTLKTLCGVTGALFLVNDRVDLALAIGADGVHLGVDDLPLEEARRLLPPTSVIGFSPETDEQAASAKLRGADYLGVGPVFGTATKPDAGPAIAIEALRRRAVLAGIPTIGIGGITPGNAGVIVHAGAVGVAVISAILASEDPERAARELTEAIATGKSLVKNE